MPAAIVPKLPEALLACPMNTPLAEAPPSEACLLRLARPGLGAADADAVVAAVAGRFSPAALRRVLASGRPQERAVAALVLGLSGSGQQTESALVRALADADAGVVEAAEHALWTLWLRGNGGAGGPAFERGLHAVAAGAAAAAAAAFEEATTRDAGFAEAHHQLGLIHAGRGRLRAAAASLAAAATCNPGHFGSLAAGGHVAVRLGELDRAETCYRAALAVHPTLAGVATALAAVGEARAARGRRAVG